MKQDRTTQSNASSGKHTISPAAGRHGRAGIVLALVLLLGACGSHERRNTGTVLNDHSLEYSIVNRIYSDPDFSEADHIKVEVYQGVVLLTGETISEANRDLATRLAEENKLTRRVVNDIQVGERVGIGGKLDNSWLTAKVNTVLLTENPLPGFDPSRIRVISSQDTVYLMGLVSREEGNTVAEIVRNIGGVERVVKVFDYTD